MGSYMEGTVLIRSPVFFILQTASSHHLADCSPETVLKKCCKICLGVSECVCLWPITLGTFWKHESTLAVIVWQLCLKRRMTFVLWSARVTCGRPIFIQQLIVYFLGCAVSHVMGVFESPNTLHPQSNSHLCNVRISMGMSICAPSKNTSQSIFVLLNPFLSCFSEFCPISFFLLFFFLQHEACWKSNHFQEKNKIFHPIQKKSIFFWLIGGKDAVLLI